MAHQVKKKSGKETKDNKGDFKTEDVLQGIIIADSFNERFKPITLQTPRALLPVANCPTIEYTLEFLAGVGVKEILIFCRAHAEKIRNYIHSHWKWGAKGSRHRSVTVQVIVSEDCYSMGDALREIDAKNLIRGDFVLVQGDLVANVDLQPALDAHRQRRVTDKNSVMTVVCRQVASGHPARSLEDQIILTVEPITQRVLHYQKTISGKEVRFPTEVLDDRDDIEIRCDLLDCHISICSPQVPPLFSDNFDYLTRDDFVRGILINEEVLGNTIHSYILDAGYTARISNLHMYDLVSRDIIGRWVYPFCPDLGFPDGDAYFYKRHHIYQQKDVQLAMDSVLEENVIVGRMCSIGENAVIRNSVIGNHCRIGANCLIDGAYIWDGCVVEAGCQLQKCVMASGCHIGRDSVVLTGAILSYDVKIGPNARVPVGTRLIAALDHKMLAGGDAEDLFQANPADKSITGDASPAGAWTVEQAVRQDSDAESDAPAVNFEETSWNWWIPTKIEDDLTDDSDSDEVDQLSDDAAGGGPSEGSRPAPYAPVEDSRIFFNEISDSLIRAVEEEHVGTDNVVLEINGSRYAYNIDIGDVNKLVMRSILEIPEIRARQRKRDFTSAKEVFSDIQYAVKRLLPVLQNFCKSTESQLATLFAVEECAVNYVDLSRHQPYGLYLNESVMKILKLLYDEDVLPEEVLTKWYSLPAKSHVRHFLPFFLHEASSQSSPRRRHQSGDLSDEDVGLLVKKIDALKVKVEPFIKWLAEAEEESD